MRRILTTASILGLMTLVAFPNDARPCTQLIVQEGRLVMDVEPPECLVFDVGDTVQEATGGLTVQYIIRNQCLANVEVVRLCTDTTTDGDPTCEPQTVSPSAILAFSQPAGASVRWHMEKVSGELTVGIFDSTPAEPSCGMTGPFGCSAAGSGSGGPMLPVLFVILVLAINYRRYRVFA